MLVVANRIARQLSRYTARNLFAIARSNLIAKGLIVCLVLMTSSVAHAQYFGGYGVWGNNMMSQYGNYGNSVMNYYGNTTVQYVRPHTPYEQRYYYGRGDYRQVHIINGRVYYGARFSRHRR